MAMGALAILVSGCTQMIAIGHEHSFCEENGYDYSDAGVCGDPLMIYKNRKRIDPNITSCEEAENE